MRLRISEIRLPLDHTQADLEALILKSLKIKKRDLTRYSVYKQSIDARKRGTVSFLYTVDAEVDGGEVILARQPSNAKVAAAPDQTYTPVRSALPDGAPWRPVIVGTGPCGLFAGLVLAQMGFRPILVEQGRGVEARIEDVNRFWRTGQLCPRSNVQFGEGGAGTFSDGKLYTQIKDRENRGRKVLEELVAAGAPDEILYSNRPHIGTDRLVKVVRNLRQAIIALGGEVRFETQVTDLAIHDQRIQGIVTASGERVKTDAVILAIGHSARDTFEMLSQRGVSLSAKPFSMGLRIEHPQRMIDLCQYGKAAGHPALGAAD
ncbi:MAG: FAD-dependent oxidoreductase, partial [Planctomycetota bacterium]